MLNLKLVAKIMPIMDLESKKYYILKPRDIKIRDIEKNGKYIILYNL